MAVVLGVAPRPFALTGRWTTVIPHDNEWTGARTRIAQCAAVQHALRGLKGAIALGAQTWSLNCWTQRMQSSLHLAGLFIQMGTCSAL